MSVDALFFHPEIKINECLDVTGMELSNAVKKKLNKKLFLQFCKEPNFFAEFIQKHSNCIKRAAFVFQIQPYRAELPTFVIHLKHTINGKANSEIINLLYVISDICKCHNIVIKSWCFDGDTGYKQLHGIYYFIYYSTLLKKTDNIFNFHIDFKRLVSDPVHLYKRFRYRFLSNCIHSGFNDDSPFIDINKNELFYTENETY